MSEDCPHCVFEKTEANCRGCFEGSHYRPKPITNAERIRSMSDEELAEWLDKLITHCNDGPCFNCFMQKACLTSMLDWLKQEANDVGQ